MINPYYDSDRIGWEIFSFNVPNLSYEFNTLCFWVTPTNEVYSASDSGCSCPIPFGGYAAETEKELEQILERVGSVEQARQIFDSWNQDYDDRPYLQSADFRELEDELEKILGRD